MRFALIGIAVAVCFVGAWLGLMDHAVFSGLTIFLVGIFGLAAERAWQRWDQYRELHAQSQWVDRVTEAADDVSLSEYGIDNLRDFASYHDEKGRAEVLAALLSRPKGERLLLAAARQIDPEAEWT